MLKELSARPESGFLGYTFGWPVIVQYWRSFEHLEAYARSHDRLHWPAMVAFHKRTRESRGDVGIWHETYQVAAGSYETVYQGMPPFGLGSVGHGCCLPRADARRPAGESVRRSPAWTDGRRRLPNAANTAPVPVAADSRRTA